MNNAPQTQTVDLSQARSRGRLVEGLRQRLEHWEPGTTAEEPTVFSCGVTAVDRLLPSGGLRQGMLLEWLPAESTSIGSGVATLGLLSAREACRDGGVLVVIDRRQTFYPPAAAAWGIDLDRLIIVHPQNARDELWAAVQALRSPAVAAMWAAIDRLDSRAFRRLQLAAQAGRTLGVLVRPASARDQPSWADLTLGIRALSAVRSQLYGSNAPPTTDRRRQIQVQVLRCHPGRASGSVVLDIDDATYTVGEGIERYELSSPTYRPALLAESR